MTNTNLDEVLGKLQGLLAGIPSEHEFMNGIDKGMTDILRNYVKLGVLKGQDMKAASKECRLLLMPIMLRFFAMKYGEEFLAGIQEPKGDVAVMEESFRRVRVREIGDLIDHLEDEAADVPAIHNRLMACKFTKTAPYVRNTHAYWAEGAEVHSSNARHDIIFAIELSQDPRELLHLHGFTRRGKQFSYKGQVGYLDVKTNQVVFTAKPADGPFENGPNLKPGMDLGKLLMEELFRNAR